MRINDVVLDTRWMMAENIKCRGEAPGLFYDFDKEVIEMAKSICSTCVAIVPCREFAITTHQQGVWGGTSDEDRNSIRKSRGLK